MRSALLALCMAPLLLLPFRLAVAGDPRLAQARASLEIGRLQEVERILNRVGTGTELEGERLILLAWLANEREDWQEAVRLGREAVKRLPASSEARLQYAVGLRTKMREINRAAAIFLLDDYKKQLRLARELDPSNLDAEEERIGFLMNAPGFAGGDKSEARARILAIRPTDWSRSMLLEAELSLHEEKPEAAAALLKTLLERDPKHEEGRSMLAGILQDDGLYREADKHYTELLAARDPRWAAHARFELARSRIVAAYETEQAIKLLREYVETVPPQSPTLPSVADALWQIGQGYEQLGRKLHAREAYEQALAVDEDHKEARRAARRLGG